ncbi:pheromone-processing carboxypeptidase KEX1-like [Venturia canescens]|uniref:pheromone-processing carboxypeptidase KEX1-like n=1 Tax=Venturia canescens TaxID=32260 RepID=UPI001C9CF4B4|nr:pheromone-processing carboxypeptidase KEX1-like [Venturia canescens]XP_043282009.1 pheromone-processing carboxypeptidase KEX1-like [Venturia canescens]
MQSSSHTIRVSVNVPRPWLSACSRTVLESILRRALRSYIVTDNDVSVKIAGVEAQLIEDGYGEFWFVPNDLLDDIKENYNNDIDDDSDNNDDVIILNNEGTAANDDDSDNNDDVIVLNDEGTAVNNDDYDNNDDVLVLNDDGTVANDDDDDDDDVIVLN